jgi:hypothetical protein
VKLAFFRPLSTALHRFEHALFGRAPALAHLHSIAWYAALAAVAAALFRRTLPATVAVLAALLFALDDAHFMPAAWIANRNALVAAVPALLGLWAYLRAREDGWKWGRALSVLGLGVGLAGGEGALGVFGYLLAYELTAGAGPWKSKLAALAPAAALGVAYVLVYKTLGYGANDSAIYVDPASTPLRFLAVAPGRALALFGSLVLSSPVDFWMMSEAAKPPLVAAGVLAVLAAWALGRRLLPGLTPDERRWAGFFGLGSVLSLLPVLATFPANRLLVFPSLGALALISLAILRLPASPGRFGRATAIVLVILHAVLPWPTWWVMPHLFDELSLRAATAAAEMEVDDGKLPEQRVLLLAAPDASVGIYAPILHRHLGGATPRAWWTLSMAPHAARVTRTSASSLELEVVDGRLLESLWEALFRAEDRPLAVGEVVTLEGARVEVLAVDGPYPTRIAFRSDTPLENEGLVLLRWDGQKLRRIAAPALGETLELPRLPGPMQPGG